MFPSYSPQTVDFKIRYTAIQRIFILPKSNAPHTLVVVSLDPPIRKGQTYYNHVLCQVGVEGGGGQAGATTCYARWGWREGGQASSNHVLCQVGKGAGLFTFVLENVTCLVCGVLGGVGGRCCSLLRAVPWP